MNLPIQTPPILRKTYSSRFLNTTGVEAQARSASCGEGRVTLTGRGMERFITCGINACDCDDANFVSTDNFGISTYRGCECTFRDPQ